MQQRDLDPLQSLRPFSNLTPDFILDAIESKGFEVDGRIAPLNSYENRVYQLGLHDGGWIVAKFYRPGRWDFNAIQEEHKFIRSLTEDELPVVAPLADENGDTLHQTHEFLWTVFPMRGGHPPELDQSDVLNQLGRLIGRIHAVGATERFKHRPELDIETYGVQPLAFLLRDSWLPEHLKVGYQKIAQLALEEVRRCYDRAGDVDLQRIHGDCYPGNLISREGLLFIVDFDDARMGPPIQDLWMLNQRTEPQDLGSLYDLLQGYEDFHTFNPRSCHLIEALRTLRQIHYSAWIAKRWKDPAFPEAFTWFGSDHYWLERIQELETQIERMKVPLFF